MALTLALVTVALAVMSAATITALRSYLLSRQDAQLQSVAHQILDPLRAGRSVDIGSFLDVDKPGQTRVRLPTDFYVEVRRPDGEQVAQAWSRLRSENQLPALPAGQLSTDEEPYNVKSIDRDDRWRVLVSELPNDAGTLIVAVSLVEVDSAVSRLLRIDLAASLGVLLLLGLVGAALVRVSLRPLERIKKTAGAIARGDLSQRVPADEGTEVGQVGAALNSMLTQIESAFAARTASERRVRQFVADASHELRTPLTSIRGFAELYRQGATDDVDGVLRRVEDEAARMGLLVDDLLLLARLDQERELDREPVDLAALLHDVTTGAEPLAADRTITVQAPEEPVVVFGDEERLRQVFRNLVGNALRHTPEGTPIELAVRGDAISARVDVVDHGPGLTAEQANRVFERFYRTDSARSGGGNGLGLAIVYALVRAHRGAVGVIPTPGGGATFWVGLPIGAPPAASPNASVPPSAPHAQPTPS